MNEIPLRFKRVLLKLSGEALMGNSAFGIDPKVLQDVATEIASAHRLGVQIGIVVGGGNIFRGLNCEAYGLGRVEADRMGMLATVINSLALAEALKTCGLDAKVMTAIDMTKIAEPYKKENALGHLKHGRVVLFGAGTGNPYFTTDTAATLRALEIEADVLLKATKVDGVYDADPVKVPTAKRFPRLSYDEVVQQDLKVMDLTAVSMAKDGKLPIMVFSLREKGNIVKAITEGKIGTLIAGDDI